jgi:hypothetical protein
VICKSGFSNGGCGVDVLLIEVEVDTSSLEMLDGSEEIDGDNASRGETVILQFGALMQISPPQSDLVSAFSAT